VKKLVHLPFLALCISISALAQYTVVDLHPAGYVTSLALAIGGGQQAGWASIGGQMHAMLWSGSADTAVDLNPAGCVSSIARGVNAMMQVGSASCPGEHALLWRGAPDNFVDLNDGASSSRAYATTDATQGGMFLLGGGRAAIWAGSPDTVTLLHPAGSSASEVHGVFGGQQAGFAQFGNSLHAMLWSGTPDSAVDLGPSSAYQDAQADAISADQQAGYVVTFDLGRHAALWTGSADSLVDLNPSGFSNTQATAVLNDQQVGFGFGTATGGHTHALVWSGTASSVLDLHQFLPGDCTDSYASGIDSDGTIAGRGQCASGTHAMIWVPQP